MGDSRFGTPCKQTEVQVFALDQYPTASCSACSWEYKPFRLGFDGKRTKIEARRHCALHGHEVLVSQQSVSTYSVPRDKS